MANVMTNGFAELSAVEMEMIDGGATVGEVLVGTLGVVAVAGVAIPAAVAGLPLLAVGSTVFGVCAFGNMVTSKN